MSKKNKFEFTEDVTEEVNEEKQEEKTEQELLDEQLARKRKIKKFSIIIGLHIIGSALLVFFGLLWQDSYKLMAWSNAFLFAFVMVFFVGWIMYIYNENIVSVFVHSIKTFGLMIVGKRPKKKYYEVKEDVEDNQVPKIYMVITFSMSLILLIPTIILTIMAF